MSAEFDRSLGLRERKKIKLRRTIQTEALRLFDVQGYEQTTVEQIAEVAETSMTTFYRYFPTKEDVVLDDDYDHLVEATISAQPTGESLATAFRAGVNAIAAATEADRDRSLARLRLMTSVPALMARYAAEQRKTLDGLARLLASRTGRATDDYELTLVAAALGAVLFTAACRWAVEQDATPFSTLLDQAITVVEPLLTALQSPASTLPHRSP